MHVILGISLGTRRLGFAVLSYGDLVKWGTHTFDRGWDKRKASEMRMKIEEYILKTHAAVLAVKIPQDIRHLSVGIQQLIAVINVLAENYGLEVCYYGNNDLKSLSCYSDCTSKQQLFETVTSYYPDLRELLLKSNRTGKQYYLKTLEAAVCAHGYHRTLDY